MLFSKTAQLSRRIKLLQQKFGVQPSCSIFTSQHLFSAKPVDLSFIELNPNTVSHSSPIIILHGFLGSKQNWRSLANVTAKKTGRKVYVLDARNHGDSPHTDEFSYCSMCEDVKQFMKSHAIANAVFIGHSMGGRTAMKLALTEKQLVNKLVVVDVSPIKLPESSLSLIPNYLSAMRKAIESVHNMSLVKARIIIDDYLAQSIPEVPIRHFLLTNLVEKDNKIVWKPNIETLEKTFGSQIFHCNAFAGCFMEETLFICGGESPYLKEDDYPMIKKLFPKVQFIVIPGAGHWVHSERPSEFLEALCNFL